MRPPSPNNTAVFCDRTPKVTVRAKIGLHAAGLPAGGFRFPAPCGCRATADGGDGGPAFQAALRDDRGRDRRALRSSAGSWTLRRLRMREPSDGSTAAVVRPRTGNARAEHRERFPTSPRSGSRHENFVGKQDDLRRTLGAVSHSTLARITAPDRCVRPRARLARERLGGWPAAFYAASAAFLRPPPRRDALAFGTSATDSVVSAAICAGLRRCWPRPRSLASAERAAE